MVQKLREDRRQLRNTNAELERERSLSTSFVAARRCNPDQVAAFENEIRSLLRYDHIAYHSHSDHPEIYEPVFERFQLGISACGPTSEIAKKMGIPLPTLYKWREQHAINSNSRSSSVRTTTKCIFTDTREETIGEELRERFS
jgi:transposase-like protein